MGGRDRLLRSMLRERFVVTIRSGEAFEGLLIDADEKTIRLADGWTVAQGRRHSIDGEIYLSRGEVLYMQRSTS